MIQNVAATSAPVEMAPYNFSIVLEQSAQGTFSRFQDEICVPPSDMQTRVRVTAEVANRNDTASDEYIATVRRRSVSSLEAKIRDLARHHEREDFEICTFPVHEYIVEFLQKLSGVRREGNSREILRMIRDSIIDGRWVRLREGIVRQAILDCLVPLRTSEFVEMAEVKRCRTLLKRCAVFRMPELDVSSLFESE